MDINSTGAHGGVVQLQSVSQANQLALAQQSNSLAAQGFSGDDSPNLTTSRAYSPALYAQAAQYQLYNSSGALSALTNSGANASAQNAEQMDTGDGSTEIHAVEETSASHIDTQA